MESDPSNQPLAKQKVAAEIVGNGTKKNSIDVDLSKTKGTASAAETGKKRKRASTVSGEQPRFNGMESVEPHPASTPVSGGSDLPTKHNRRTQVGAGKGKQKQQPLQKQQQKHPAASSSAETEGLSHASPNKKRKPNPGPTGKNLHRSRSVSEAPTAELLRFFQSAVSAHQSSPSQPSQLFSLTSTVRFILASHTDPDGPEFDRAVDDDDVWASLDRLRSNVAERLKIPLDQASMIGFKAGRSELIDDKDVRAFRMKASRADETVLHVFPPPNWAWASSRSVDSLPAGGREGSGHPKNQIDSRAIQAASRTPAILTSQQETSANSAQTEEEDVAEFIRKRRGEKKRKRSDGLEKGDEEDTGEDAIDSAEVSTTAGATGHSTAEIQSVAAAVPTPKKRGRQPKDKPTDPVPATETTEAGAEVTPRKKTKTKAPAQAAQEPGNHTQDALPPTTPVKRKPGRPSKASLAAEAAAVAAAAAASKQAREAAAASTSASDAPSSAEAEVATAIQPAKKRRGRPPMKGKDVATKVSAPSSAETDPEDVPAADATPKVAKSKGKQKQKALNAVPDSASSEQDAPAGPPSATKRRRKQASPATLAESSAEEEADMSAANNASSKRSHSKPPQGKTSSAPTDDEEGSGDDSESSSDGLAKGSNVRKGCGICDTTRLHKPEECPVVKRGKEAMKERYQVLVSLGRHKKIPARQAQKNLKNLLNSDADETDVSDETEEEEALQSTTTGAIESEGQANEAQAAEKEASGRGKGKEKSTGKVAALSSKMDSTPASAPKSTPSKKASSALSVQEQRRKLDELQEKTRSTREKALEWIQKQTERNGTKQPLDGYEQIQATTAYKAVERAQTAVMSFVEQYGDMSEFVNTDILEPLDKAIAAAQAPAPMASTAVPPPSKKEAASGTGLRDFSPGSENELQASPLLAPVDRPTTAANDDVTAADLMSQASAIVSATESGTEPESAPSPSSDQTSEDSDEEEEDAIEDADSSAPRPVAHPDSSDSEGEDDDSDVEDEEEEAVTEKNTSPPGDGNASAEEEDEIEYTQDAAAPPNGVHTHFNGSASNPDPTPPPAQSSATTAPLPHTSKPTASKASQPSTPATINKNPFARKNGVATPAPPSVSAPVAAARRLPVGFPRLSDLTRQSKLRTHSQPNSPATPGPNSLIPPSTAPVANSKRAIAHDDESDSSSGSSSSDSDSEGSSDGQGSGKAGKNKATESDIPASRIAGASTPSASKLKPRASISKAFSFRKS